jgi:nicotinamidase-related amidase
MPTTPFDRGRTAVLIMDYQNDILTSYADGDPGLLGRAAGVLSAARDARLPVIYVVVQFRPGYPEVAQSGVFNVVRQSGRFQEGTRGAAIHDAVAPQPGEPVVTKRRIGAASGSDLECVLRGLGRTHLVLLGIATSGVVLSTARWAADLDYKMNIISDCCADRDPEVHRILIEKVLAGMAPPITARDFIESLAASS